MKIIEVKNSKFASIIGYSITLYPFIFYKGVPTSEVRNHEFVHIEQIKKIGVFKFYLSYLLFYAAFRLSGLGHNQAYYSIPYEVEAYKRTGG